MGKAVPENDLPSGGGVVPADDLPNAQPMASSAPQGRNISPAEAFASNAGSSLLFGAPELAASLAGSDYFERAKQQNPNAALAGDVAGMISPVGLGAKAAIKGGTKLAEILGPSIGKMLVGKEAAAQAGKAVEQAGAKHAEDVIKNTFTKNTFSGGNLEGELQLLIAKDPKVAEAVGFLKQAKEKGDPKLIKDARDYLFQLTGAYEKAAEAAKVAKQAEKETIKRAGSSALSTAGKIAGRTTAGVLGGQAGAAATGAIKPDDSAFMRSQVTGDVLTAPLKYIPGIGVVSSALTNIIPGAFLLGGSTNP